MPLTGLHGIARDNYLMPQVQYFGNVRPPLQQSKCMILVISRLFYLCKKMSLIHVISTLNDSLVVAVKYDSRDLTEINCRIRNFTATQEAGFAELLARNKELGKTTVFGIERTEVATELRS